MIDPTGNTQLMGLYRAGATYCTQCEAEGFRRITYFLDRPDVMAVYTRASKPTRPKRRCCCRTATSSRAAICRPGRHFAVWHDPFPKPSYLFALVGGNLASSRTASPPCAAARSRSQSMSSPARRPRAATPWTPQARHALGRAALRPRIRSRYFHDRRRLRLQHGRDGEQGAQRLQRQIRAGHAGDRDRRRFRQHRSGDRARIFSQLDRQPHHLPRLVPALPEGRPHCFPRPGVHRGHALARRCKRIGDVRGCAPRSSSRMPARSPTRCGPRSITRSTISTPRPSTRRAPRWCG